MIPDSESSGEQAFNVEALTQHAICINVGSTRGQAVQLGEYRIPFSGDLDIGAGEFSVNPKYYDMGWNEFRQD